MFYFLLFQVDIGDLLRPVSVHFSTAPLSGSCEHAHYGI